ncbi:hypothetical protein HGRIS_008982 [Hohenbuehelia grisea]|uniref:Uncharacterized protein n=1 Tax=Hohenbuehelia grisea TaxID=104357 RepID=A0ABR3IZQ6_9AGAR
MKFSLILVLPLLALVHAAPVAHPEPILARQADPLSGVTSVVSSLVNTVTGLLTGLLGGLPVVGGVAGGLGGTVGGLTGGLGGLTGGLGGLTGGLPGGAGGGLLGRDAKEELVESLQEVLKLLKQVQSAAGGDAVKRSLEARQDPTAVVTGLLNTVVDLLKNLLGSLGGVAGGGLPLPLPLPPLPVPVPQT